MKKQHNFLDQGKICIDGIETSERPLAQLRQFIRDVSQSDDGMVNLVRDDFINESHHMRKISYIIPPTDG